MKTIRIVISAILVVTIIVTSSFFKPNLTITYAQITETYKISEIKKYDDHFDYVVNTGRNSKSSHYHFRANVDLASWTLYRPDGSTFSAGGSFEAGDQWFNASQFIVNDYSTGVTTNNFVRGTVTISYTSVESCIYEKSDIKRTNATCTSSATYYYKCKYCGNLYGSYSKGSALGHNYSHIKTINPTIYTDGDNISTCSRCGNEKHEPIVKYHFSIFVNGSQIKKIARGNKLLYEGCGLETPFIVE